MIRKKIDVECDDARSMCLLSLKIREIQIPMQFPSLLFSTLIPSILHPIRIVLSRLHGVFFFFPSHQSLCSQSMCCEKCADSNPHLVHKDVRVPPESRKFMLTFFFFLLCFPPFLRNQTCCLVYSPFVLFFFFLFDVFFFTTHHIMCELVQF